MLKFNHNTLASASDCQEIKSIKDLADKFAFSTEPFNLSAGKAIMAKAAACMSEAILISLIEDQEMSHALRLEKIKGVLDKLPLYTKEFDVDMKRVVCARVMSEAVNKLLSGPSSAPK